MRVGEIMLGALPMDGLLDSWGCEVRRHGDSSGDGLLERLGPGRLEAGAAGESVVCCRLACGGSREVSDTGSGSLPIASKSRSLGRLGAGRGRGVGGVVLFRDSHRTGRRVSTSSDVFGCVRDGVLSGKEKKWAEKNGLFPGLLGGD